MTHLPQYLSFADAARERGLSEKELKRQIEAGIISAIVTNGETLVIAMADEASLLLSPEIKTDPSPDISAIAQVMPPQRSDLKYKSIEGQKTTINDASKEYNIPRDNIFRWVKDQYIKLVKPGGPGVAMEIDKADMAFCADVYQWRKTLGFGRNVPLLDEKGEASYPRYNYMAQYQRDRRAQMKKALSKPYPRVAV